MRITDGRMVVELDEEDPRAVRIRAILFEQRAVPDPVKMLWDACSDEHRRTLVAIAERGEVTQPDIERVLEINALALRGRHGGLARLAKRLGVSYPIASAGGRRKTRRFSLAANVSRQILKLNQQTNNRRNKP